MSMVTLDGVQAFVGYPEDGALPAEKSQAPECSLCDSPHPDREVLYGHFLLATGAFWEGHQKEPSSSQAGY